MHFFVVMVADGRASVTVSNYFLGFLYSPRCISMQRGELSNELREDVSYCHSTFDIYTSDSDLINAVINDFGSRRYVIVSPQKRNNSSKNFVRLCSTTILHGTINPLEVIKFSRFKGQEFKPYSFSGRNFWDVNDWVKHTSNLTVNEIRSSLIVKGGFYYGGTTPD